MPAISETVRVKVRFSEVDPIRMVWHGNYIKYLEDAREAFGHRYGISYLQISGHGYYAPIYDLQVRPGSKAKLHGSNMDKVTKIVFGETEVPVTFVDKGEESYVEYEVPNLPLGTYKVKLIDAEGIVYGGGSIELSNDVPEIKENILWEGHHYVSWDLPDGDPNKTFNLITKEQFTSLSAGTKLLIHYTLEPSAEYHQMQLTTMWWTELPGTAKTDLTEDGVMELAITQDMLNLVNEQDGFLCVGHGYYVDKITAE